MRQRFLSLKIAALIVFTCCCTDKAGNGLKAATAGKTVTKNVPADTTTHRVTMLFAGDLMQHDGQIKAARTATGYEYDEVFAYVKPQVSAADIAVANFEVTLAGPPYKGYPTFSAPDEYLRAAINAGFDILMTANNHCCDTRAKGLERTLKMMDSLKVGHLGTYRNAAERERDYPFIVEKNGIKIALINFTYSTNGIPVPQPYVVNMLDTTQIGKDIRRARQMKPDVIIALPHWGVEYAQIPSQQQRELTEWMLRSGVDHVIGGHPHVVQPFEVRQSADNSRHLVAYSLGNYVSNQTKLNTDGGAMINLTLEKKNGKTRLADCDYTLFWVSRPLTSGKKNFRIYPSYHPTDQMNAAEKNLRWRYLNSTRTLFKKHNKGIQERKKFSPTPSK